MTSDVIHALVTRCCEEWDCDPSSINHGMCDEFAYLLQAALGGGTVLELSLECDTVWPTHFWVKYGDLHYDAEAPDGVPNWRDLPVFSKCDKSVSPSDNDLVES